MVRRLWGQDSTGPRAVLGQSTWRMSWPSSPPPAKRLAEERDSDGAVRRYCPLTGTVSSASGAAVRSRDSKGRPRVDFGKSIDYRQNKPLARPELHRVRAVASGL